MKSKISYKPLQTPNCLTRVLPTLWKPWAFKIWPSPHLGKPALEGAPCKDPTLEEFPGHREWPWRGSLGLPWHPFHPAQVSLLHDTRDQLRGFLLSQNPKLLPSTSPLQELFQQKAEKSTAEQSWGWPQVSAVDLQVLAWKTRVAVREAQRPSPSLTTPVPYCIPHEVLKWSVSCRALHRMLSQPLCTLVAGHTQVSRTSSSFHNIIVTSAFLQVLHL